MKRRKLTALLVGLLTLSLLATACTTTKKANVDVSQSTDKTMQVINAKNPTIPQQAKDRTDTLVWGCNAQKSLNPLYVSSTYDWYACNLIFDSLLDVDNTGQPTKDVADSWEQSKDGLSYTFHLRKDIKFTNGQPLTADDVIFTYLVVADPSYTGYNDLSPLLLKGYADYKAGKSKDFPGIQKIDDYTIQFNLTDKNAAFIYNVNTQILPKSYYGTDFKYNYTKGVEDKIKTPVGSGPYKLTSFIPDQEVRLTANTDYFRGAPKIKNVIFRACTDDQAPSMLKSGEIDMWDTACEPQYVQQITDAGDSNMYICPYGGYGQMGMNCKDPILSDVKVRQAIAYGFNRAAFVKVAYGTYASVINAPVSVTNWTYDDSKITKYDYNPTQAGKLLDEAGWKMGTDGYRYKDGKELTIRFLQTADLQTTEQLVGVIKPNMQAIGVNFVPEIVDFNTLLGKVSDPKNLDWQTYFMGGGSGVDPDCTILFGTNAAGNYYQYSNPTVDNLLRTGLTTLDQNQRKAIYGNLWKQLNYDLPTLPVYQRRELLSVNARIIGAQDYTYKDPSYFVRTMSIK